MNKRNETTAQRIANHPMYSKSDLKYFRDKGYSDEEILAFWDRDHKQGCTPVQHRLTYTGMPEEVLKEVVRDNLSPEAVAVIAAHLRAVTATDPAVQRQIEWFAGHLVDVLGVDRFNRLCEEAGL